MSNRLLDIITEPDNTIIEMSNPMTIQDRIDIVKGKVESLVQTGINPANLIYNPTELYGLTAQQFAELRQAFPEMRLHDHTTTRYSGAFDIQGVRVWCESAYDTRVTRPSDMAAELDALIASAQ
jgi:hypothetical protein